MSRKIAVALTEAQIRALREAAIFRLAGEHDGTFDARTLDRADDALVAAADASSSEGGPMTSSRALRRAAQATRAAGGDPAVAAELESLRRLRQGTYALMFRLVEQLGGPIRIPRVEWESLPPGRRLKVELDAERNVTLFLADSDGSAGAEDLTNLRAETP